MTAGVVVRKWLPDGTSFPDNTDDLEWRLRYAPETITRGDQLTLASICSAYRYLAHEATQERRNYVCRHLRKANTNCTKEANTSYTEEAK